MPKPHSPETVRAVFKEWFVGGESDRGEIRAFCPLCEDPATSKTPSASFNPEKGLWFCNKKDHGGTTVSLATQLEAKTEGKWKLRSVLMRARNEQSDWTAKKEEGQRRAGVRSEPLPTEEEITAWNKTLTKTPRILDALQEKRGIDLQTIDDYLMGWDRRTSRYTIPVYDVNGDLINVRKYKIDPRPGEPKMTNVTGHGKAAIYGVDELVDFNKVVITEGEMDCLLLRQHLREGSVKGICVVSATSGSEHFNRQWVNSFAGKEVWVCYDADQAGRGGARKVQRMLEKVADNVYIVNIPEHPDMKGTDITDYLYKQNFGIENFMELMDVASKGKVDVKKPLALSGRKVSLLDSQDVRYNHGQELEIEGSVIGLGSDPYSSPKKILATCDMSKGPNICNVCPLSANLGTMETEIRVDDPRHINFVSVNRPAKRMLLREITGALCTDRVTFEEVEKHGIQPLLVQPSIDDRSDGETRAPMVRQVFAMGDRVTESNAKIRMVGHNVDDPRDNKSRFVAWVTEKVEVDIDTFQLTPYIRSQLNVFRPVDDETPLQRCLKIAHDISENVTQIYERDILHVAYDLAFHSVLAFQIPGKTVRKGWIDMLVIGDTRTGKSEIAHRLIQHYRVGRLFSCEGASFAGIVGGNQKMDSGQQYLTWGVVPFNDRRLVVLDEMSGIADQNVIERMSSIRSDGVAQITKIADGETSARTRLIWISNPKEGSLRSWEDGGVSALQDIVKLEEDQARFDYVIAARRNDVDSKVVNDPTRRSKEPKYSSEACELLVKWVWSLTRDDVRISAGAVRYAFDEGRRMGEAYIPDPPLIQGENVREKILRIACALAARTFSCDRNGKLIVEREHVADAVRFLDRIYSEEAMGYKLKSKAAITAHERATKRKGVVKNYLLEHDMTVLHTLLVMRPSRVSRLQREFKDLGAMDEMAARDALNVLIRDEMIVNRGKGEYAMTDVLREILREIEMDRMR